MSSKSAPGGLPNDGGSGLLGDQPVVIREPRGSMLLSLLIGGAFEAGLVYAVGMALFSGQPLTDPGVSRAGAIAMWTVVVVFAALIGLALVRLVMTLAQPPSRLVLTNRECVELRGDQVIRRVSLEQVCRLTYYPAQRTTWTGPARPGEPRWLASSRLSARLAIEADRADFGFYSSRREWPGVVDHLREWARLRPELAGDETSRRFLSEQPTETPGLDTGSDTPPARKRRRTVFLMVWACAAVGLCWVLGVVPGPSMWFSVLVLSLLFAAMVWFGGVVLIEAGLGIWRFAQGNPWWLFLPRPDGRYASVVSGRMSLLRATAPGSAAGLAWRWAFVLLQVAAVLLVGYFLVRGVGIFVDLRSRLG